jgi:hypothetical protein
VKFSEAKAKAVEALRTGDYRIGVRDDITQNYLATNQISNAEAAEILSKARGPGELRKHHFLEVDIWILKPDNWYVKFYFIDAGWFISFKPQEKEVS